ncbi:hypothetical protein ACSBR2_029230 [Camellia fascicularis]
MKKIKILSPKFAGAVCFAAPTVFTVSAVSQIGAVLLMLRCSWSCMLSLLQMDLRSLASPSG